MVRKITDVVKHSGVVERIDGSVCFVRILQHSACSGCAAHKLCNSSESKEKIVEASFHGMELQVGDTVNVEGTVVQGLRAVYLCYLIPLFFMVLILFVGFHVGGDMMGISFSLSFLALYYFVLYLCRNSIGRHFGFTVSKN